MRYTSPLLSAVRYLAPHTLLTPSPYIRALPGGANSLSQPLPPSLASDFVLFPKFFSVEESRDLLTLALWKLDKVDSTRKRRRRGSLKDDASTTGDDLSHSLQNSFVPPYGFEEGHYDSVIHEYRESLITSLPPGPNPTLLNLLARLYSLVPSLQVPTESELSEANLPPKDSSTHALHLSPEGAILPHVDNLEASGATIVGASLGSSRVLRLERSKNTGSSDPQGWDVLLPSGSVYVQNLVRGSVRYQYAHSILPYNHPESSWDGQSLERGHRVSLMVRDAPMKATQL